MHEDKSEKKSYLQIEKERELEREQLAKKRLKKDREEYFKLLKEEEEEMKEEAKNTLEKIKEKLDNFLKLPDVPLYTYKEQNAFLEKSIRTQAPEDKKKYLESKKHKYVVNKLSIPLMCADMLLKEPDVYKINISEKDRNRLIKRTMDAMDRINEQRAAGMTKEIVDEVTDIAKTLKSYIE